MEENSEEIKDKPIRVHQNHIPLLDKVTLGPIKKYVKYNRFPWKMLIHIIFVMIVTAKVKILIDLDSSLANAEQKVFFREFLDEDLELNGLDFEKTRLFFSTEEIKDFAAKSVNNYYSLETGDFLENYRLPRVEVEPGVEEIKPVRLDVFYRRSAARSMFQNLQYNLTQSYLGPFELPQTEFQQFLSNTTHLQLMYFIETAIPTSEVEGFD